MKELTLDSEKNIFVALLGIGIFSSISIISILTFIKDINEKNLVILFFVNTISFLFVYMLLVRIKNKTSIKYDVKNKKVTCTTFPLFNPFFTNIQFKITSTPKIYSVKHYGYSLYYLPRKPNYIIYINGTETSISFSNKKDADKAAKTIRRVLF